MEGLLVILVLIVVGIMGFAWFQRQRLSQIGKRAETLWRSEHPDQPSGAAPREPTVETLRLGDAVSFWDGEDALVDTVLQCAEGGDVRHTEWRWNLLRGGRMIETAPDGNVLYNSSQVHPQDDPMYATLTGEPINGGVLKTFEMKVREGSVGLNPVFFDYQGKRFRMRSTGTFGATPLGARPTADVWRDVVEDPRQNVYFEFDAEDGTQGLGIWTTLIVVLVGESLKTTDIRAIYPGQAAPA